MKTIDIIKLILFFSLFQFILLFTPGPAYYFGLLLIFFFGSFFVTKDLTISLFFIYLLVFFNSSPLIQLNNQTAVPLDFSYQQTFFAPITETVTLKTVVSYIFFVSIFFNLKIRMFRLLANYKYILLPITIMLVLTINQLYGNYQAHTVLSYLTLSSLFLPFISTLAVCQLNKRASARLFFVFCFSSLLVQFTLSIMQLLSFQMHLEFLPYLTQLTTTSFSSFQNFRAQGAFSHPNFLAVNIGILCSFILISFSNVKFHCGDKHLAALTKAAFFLGVFTIVLSKTRIVLAVVLLILLVILAERFYKLIIAALKNMEVKLVISKIQIIQLVIAACLFLFLLNRSEGLTTLEGRYVIFSQAIEIISDNPLFGTGPELSTFYIADFYSLEHEYMDSLRGIHTSILLFTAENGLLVGILVVIYFYFLIRNVSNNIKNSNNLPLSKMAFHSLIFFITVSFFYPLYIYDSSLELIQIITAISVFRLVTPQRKKQSSNITTFSEQNSRQPK